MYTQTSERYYPETDMLYVSGLALTVVSFLVFCIPHQQNQDFFSGNFLANFIIAAGYFLVLLVSGRLRKGRHSLPLLFNFLVLFLISCYSLNKTMTVFDESTEWFSVLLIIICVNYVLFPFFDRLPRFLQVTMLLITGVAWATVLYLSLYLMPFYVFGLIGFLFFGISLHVFVPLLLSIYTAILIKRYNHSFTYCRRWFFTGFTLAVVSVIVYTAAWGVRVHHLKAMVQKNRDLPSWLVIAQHSSGDLLAEKVLKSELVYSAVESNSSNFFWRTPDRGNWGRRMHDPLAMIGSFFGGNLQLSFPDQRKVLKTVFGAQHQDEERLWSGNDLNTRDVKTEIMIWPDMRIAYTEMLLEVFNASPKENWPGQQEGIYSFYLPEGSVVTSLSLWINGREEKAVLTTKSKAVKAYNTIVGVQFRDPSVVHWQEGNRVSVRVFPVINNDFRKFKIGITSPLKLSGNRLHYQPVNFEGPELKGADIFTKVRFSTMPGVLKLPSEFSQQSTHYEAHSLQQDDWDISFDAAELSNKTFSFNQQVYSLSPNNTLMEPTVIKAVYLDVNAAWTKQEFNAVCDMLQEKELFVANQQKELVAITPGNKNTLFNELHKCRFSLFPFYKIKDDKNALVVTRSGLRGPVMQDIREDDFYKQLNVFFAAGRKVKLFNLGEKNSLYLSALKECRAFRYASGDMDALFKMINTQMFPLDNDRQDEVLIDAARMCIRKNPGEKDSTAPDHFMRLYAYNNILKNSGIGLLSGAEPEPALIAEAEEANIVTPVSSLVVLETQKDYDDFDIKKSKDGLQNAAMQSKGAVPEPHEWALMIIAALLLLYIRYQSYIDSKIGSWMR